MNCQNCGELLDPGAAFCGNCGQAVSGGEAVSQPVGPSSAPTAEPSPVSPVAQVYNNQGAGNQVTVGHFGTPAVGMSSGGSMSAYAVNSEEKTGETKAIIGLILGVMGIPGSLIPLLGIALGISGLVLSTTARAKYKHALSLFGIIFSCLAILSGLGLWTWAISHDSKLRSASGSSSVSSSAVLVPISTSCYSVQIDSGLNNYSPSDCNFNAANTSEEYTVNATYNSSLTAANLTQVGQTSLASAAKIINGTITSGGRGIFAGSPAYIAYMRTTNNQSLIAAVVLHQVSNDSDNFFVVIRVSTGSNQAAFGTLESTWQWN